MAQAVIDPRAAEAKCPAWCLGQHLNDDAIEGVVHQRPVTVGEMTVMIEETTGAPAGVLGPVGPVITDLEWIWVSDQSIRNLAAALNAAADLIGVSEVTA